MSKNNLISSIIYYSEGMYSKEDLKGFSKKALKNILTNQKARLGGKA